jgi:Uma2 family endonuclease
MTVTIPIPNISLSPGSQISISGVTWKDFEGTLLDLGEKRNSRITYYQGKLEIMSPLAIHERPHRIISYIIMTILEVQGRSWEDFGSTTLKRSGVAGIEPDTCFYIENAALVRNCTNLNLEDYPPPDLAIECDVTSKTVIDAYQAIGVPEVWIYSDRKLNIYIFTDKDSELSYQLTTNSPTFPDLSIADIVPQLIQKAIAEGTNQMLKDLKAIISKSNRN